MSHAPRQYPGAVNGKPAGYLRLKADTMAGEAFAFMNMLSGGVSEFPFYKSLPGRPAGDRRTAAEA
jgi:hypothetical protein